MTVDDGSDTTDIMTSKEMAQAVRSEALIDYDGFGEYLDETKRATGEIFSPSTFEASKAPFVKWYNR